MNFQGLLTVLVAAACILAIGVASTSLNAVETEPSDVLDTSFVPTQDNQPDSSQSSGGGGGGGTDLERSEDADPSASLEQTQGVPEKVEAGGSDVKSAGAAAMKPLVTFWDRLWYTIMQNLVYILGGLGAFVAAVTGYFVYKRRFAGGTPGSAEIVYDVDTSNEVYKSWWEMVEMADVDDPTTKTPQEFAEVAIEEGYDPEAVSELTRLFEEALYGGEEITKKEERMAKEAIERIKSKGREVV